MLEHMKTRHTESAQEKEWYTPEELFPDHHAGDAIRGLRYRENLTQKQLAEKIGINAQNLSHMEHGRQPVGEEMAKRFAKVLNTDWRLFMVENYEQGAAT